MRGHLSLQSHIGRELPLQLKMEKRIPGGEDVGNSASDTATIAISQGSNVLFFLSGLLTGAGQIVEAGSSTAKLHAVVVFPYLGCSTAEIYRQADGIISHIENPRRRP